MMCSKKLFVICYVLVTVKSGHENSRQGRLLSFHVMDDDISVSLDFNIPFITIPVKKTMDAAYGSLSLPTVNINPAALAVGGFVVLGSTIVLPFLMKTYMQHNFEKRYSRILDSTEFAADGVISFASQLLADKRSIRSCTLRIACWTAQRDFMDSSKIFSRITSNKLLSSMINSTAVEDAMLSGKDGRDCDTYSPCPLSNQHISILLNNLSVLIPLYRDFV